MMDNPPDEEYPVLPSCVHCGEEYSAIDEATEFCDACYEFVLGPQEDDAPFAEGGTDAA